MFYFAKRFAPVYLILSSALTGTCALAAQCPQIGYTVVEPHSTKETRPVKWGAQTIFVRKIPITTTSDITSLKVVTDAKLLDGPDDAVIQLTFTPAADKRLHEATSNHSGMRIAFMINDRVLVNVVWQGPYGMDTGGAQVSVNHGRQQLKALPKAVRHCISEKGDQIDHESH